MMPRGGRVVVVCDVGLIATTYVGKKESWVCLRDYAMV